MPKRIQSFSKSINEALEQSMKKNKNVIIKIGSLAENQVSESVKALLSEPIAGKEVKKTEIKIDKLDVKIDLVSLHQNAAAAHQQDRDSKEREAVENTHSKGDFNIKT